jgi:hypothetical protein|tara:strand:- start:369 stop:716 length:348 start_codon:yes stop_codon:yes gene_type:complete
MLRPEHIRHEPIRDWAPVMAAIEEFRAEVVLALMDHWRVKQMRRPLANASVAIEWRRAGDIPIPETAQRYVRQALHDMDVIRATSRSAVTVTEAITQVDNPEDEGLTITVEGTDG